jgi:uncharacterized protein YndB with AHSA1/START domain
MNKPATVYVTYIASTREKVWQALTDTEFNRQYWIGGSVMSDWLVGSTVQYLREDGAVGWQGEVLQADEPHLLSYTFHMSISEEHRAEKPSRVSFELEEVQGVVKLTLTHDELAPGSKTAETTQHGWAAIMSSLKSLMETGHPLPFSRLGFAPSQQEKTT